MDTSTLKCMFSSIKLDYSTPQGVFDQLNKEFNFNIDACANENNHKVSTYFNGDDGLKKRWAKVFKYSPYYPDEQEVNGRVFVNPPYGREIGKWLQKGWEEFYIHCNCDTIVFLIPSRTDTRWFHDYIMSTTENSYRGATEIRFVKGRLKFQGAINSAPFPSAIVIFKR